MLGSIWFQKCSCEQEIWFASSGSGTRKKTAEKPKYLVTVHPYLYLIKARICMKRRQDCECSDIAEITPHSCASCIQNNLVQILTQTEHHCVHFSVVNWKVILIFLLSYLFVKSLKCSPTTESVLSLLHQTKCINNKNAAVSHYEPSFSLTETLLPICHYWYSNVVGDRRELWSQMKLLVNFVFRVIGLLMGREK